LYTKQLPIPLPGLEPLLSGSALRCNRALVPKKKTQFPVPVAGRDPAIHVLSVRSATQAQDVDTRVEPAQGVPAIALRSSCTTGFAEPDSRGLGPAKTIFVVQHQSKTRQGCERDFPRTALRLREQFLHDG
jgi:hypothetical protein